MGKNKKALVIPTSGPSKVVVLDGSLDALQRAVGNGENVTVDCVTDALAGFGMRGVDLWVDDEGLINGLPINLAHPLDFPEFGGEGTEALAGTIVALGGDPDTGESVGLTDEQVAKVRALIPKLREEGAKRALRAMAATGKLTVTEV